MKYKLAKRLCAVLLSFFVTVSFSGGVMAAQRLYSKVSEETVTKGVTYQFDRRLTVEGFQDIHVLKIDLTAENVVLQPVESVEQYGLKETALKILWDNGALAGVNGDFFGMKGNYSASFGPVIREGELISAGTDRNLESYDYSTFFLDKEGNPFIDYFQFKADFLSNGGGHLELASVNKITEMKYPICFTRAAADTTAALDARFPGLVKFVVEEDVITKISAKGETVPTPETDKGYLIIVNSETADAIAPYFAVGQTAELKTTASLDLTNIETAISGVGRILVNGQVPESPGLVISGRQPRTALGISQDGKSLILMVVDGRSHSIGASQNEMAALMQEYGAYNAMHFDGGGSSTMVAKTINNNNPEVKNTVSDGTQRKVMNAFGVFNVAPLGQLHEIALIPEQERGFWGDEVKLTLVGYDETYHKIEIPEEEATFTTSDADGKFVGNTYIVGNDASTVLTATYNGLTAIATLQTIVASSITPQQDALYLQPGESATLALNGVSVDGYAAPLTSGATYALTNPAIGSITGNTFTASGEGSGFIRCDAGGATCYIKVSVGGMEKAITSFEGQMGISSSSYPTSLAVGGAVSSSQVIDGTQSLELSYTPEASTETQAAYIQFQKPITVGGRPIALRMQVNGTSSGHWLRGTIKDANGKESVIEFTQNIDWNGWKQVSANIPEGVAYPISFTSIYAAATSNGEKQTYTLYFDQLAGVYMNDPGVAPASTIAEDPLNQEVSGKQPGSYYINLAGTVTSGVVAAGQDYDAVRAGVHSQLEQDADLAVYAGKSDVSFPSQVETIKWWKSYGNFPKSGVSVIQLTAENGTLRNTLPEQWLYFKNDALQSDNKNILFIMDKTPSHFSDGLEANLFRDVLQELTKEGKRVFVISSEGKSVWHTVKEGVRYMNLPDLWNFDGSVNPNFKTLRFQITGDEIAYSYQ